MFPTLTKTRLASTVAALILGPAALSAPAVADPLPSGPVTHHVVFSAFGGGEVFSIVTDPDTGLVPDHTPLPFTRAIDIGPDVTMLQIVATGRDATNRIDEIGSAYVLQDVPRGARHDGVEKRLVVGVGSQHQALQLGKLITQITAN